MEKKLNLAVFIEQENEKQNKIAAALNAARIPKDFTLENEKLRFTFTRREFTHVKQSIAGTRLVRSLFKGINSPNCAVFVSMFPSSKA